MARPLLNHLAPVAPDFLPLVTSSPSLPHPNTGLCLCRVPNHCRMIHHPNHQVPIHRPMNAFGSVSHDLLWFMMNRLQVPTPFIDLCKSIYAGSSQRVRCSEGFTDDIPVNVGMKQGCLLSPLLFNLALEVFLPALDCATSGYSMESGSRLKQLA